MGSQDVFKTGRRSGSLANADKYEQSARYRLRNERKANKTDIVRFAASLPKLFGRKTFIFAMLARVPMARQVQLHRVIGEDALQGLIATERSGLIVRWNLLRGSGYGVTLNPDYPGIELIRKALLAIQPEAVDAVDLSWSEADEIPSSATRPVDVDLLFGTAVRTKTLATLEVLGGSARRADLHSSVPRELGMSVKQAIRFYVSEGILTNDHGRISFAKKPWTRTLRKLLRVLIMEGLEIESGVAERRVGKSVSKRRHQKFGFFGRSGAQSVLRQLAVNGPTTVLRLQTATFKSDITEILRPFERMGVVGSRPGKRRAKIVGLNAAHPVYWPLRRLLLAIAGKAVRRPPDLVYPAPEGGFGVDELFATELRLDVLLALVFAEHGEMDASSMGRLLNEYTQAGMHLRLHWFQNEGIVAMREWKGLVFFRLDSNYQHYKPLLALLLVIGKHWPERVEGFAFEYEIHPQKRKATERGRTGPPRTRKR